MDFIQFVLILVVAGVVLWLVNKYVPMQPQMKTVLNVAVVVAAIIFAIIVVFHVDIRNFGHWKI